MKNNLQRVSAEKAAAVLVLCNKFSSDPSKYFTTVHLKIFPIYYFFIIFFLRNYKLDDSFLWVKEGPHSGSFWSFMFYCVAAKTSDNILNDGSTVLRLCISISSQLGYNNITRSAGSVSYKLKIKKWGLLNCLKFFHFKKYFKLCILYNTS